MTETHGRDSQFDRLESKLDQVLDRLIRIEERSEAHGGKLHAHQDRLDEHATRLRDVELSHAVSSATHMQAGKQLQGRWAALGAVALVILSGIGIFLSNLIIKAFHIGP